MKCFVCGVSAVALLAATPLYADDAAINDLKAKIFDANVAKQTFVNGAKFCKDLDGATNFYFGPRDRVLDVEDYHRSLENLVKQRVFNPETRQPWTEKDAGTRWEQVQKETVKDKANCDLIASLPFLQKKLQELEANSQASQKRN